MKNDLEIQRLLGSGTFGLVFQGVYTKDHIKHNVSHMIPDDEMTKGIHIAPCVTISTGMNLMNGGGKNIPPIAESVESIPKTHSCSVS